MQLIASSEDLGGSEENDGVGKIKIFFFDFFTLLPKKQES